MNALWCKAPFLSEDKKSDSCRRPRDVSFENVCVKPVLVSSHGGGCRRSFLTPTFTVVIAKMVNFGINLPKRGIPLSDFFFTKFGFGRESQVRTLMPNFTVVALMALKMWAYSPRNHHNWYFFGTNLPKMAVYNTSLSKTSRGFSVKAHLLVILTKESVQTRVFRASPQFFIKRRRSAVIAFLGGFPPNISPSPTPRQKNHFGDLSMQNLLQRQRRSVSRTLM